MLEVFALAAGLAMDATAVAALRGMQNRQRDRSNRDAIMLPLLFGLFQAGMTALGWLVGELGGGFVAEWDHWIAFGLLLAIGGKMIVSGWKASPDDADAEEDKAGLGVDIGLAIATSIDAAAAGITISIVPVSPVVAIGVIGVITVAFCAIGYAAGRAAGRHLGTRLELIGGVILVGIGVRVLMQHL